MKDCDYKIIGKCRICGNPNLTEVVNLGKMTLTGVFPKSKDKNTSSGPLSLVKCTGNAHACGLLQLKQTYDFRELYGLNYGYRSGLNKSMVDHLHSKINKIMNIAELKNDDLIIDIGSNDGTALAAYPSYGLNLVGIDPTGIKFKDFYKPHIKLISDFFSKNILFENYGVKKAKIVTSFSMFYDLENPLSFMQEVYDILDEEGIWAFEQSYMPTMLKTNSFDTICQEHIEYYALKQIKWMADKIGLKIINIEFNNINGGSFSLIAAKKNSHYSEAFNLEEVLKQERDAGLDGLQPYIEFSKNIEEAKRELVGFINKVKDKGRNIFGLGASTKGNVLLQHCGITEKDIPFIGEINAEKFGSYTPGTFIPIISEEDLLAKAPDYLLVLPWHFKEFFIKMPKFKHLKLVFPLPKLEVV